MPATLHSYLEQRARQDYLAACNIFKIATAGSSVGRDIAILERRKEWLKLFDPAVVDKLEKIVITNDALDEIKLYFLAAAGEAIKRLEDEIPTIHARAPEFPWKSFKRIRDLNTQLGKELLYSPAYYETLDKIHQEIDYFNSFDSFDETAEKLADLPRFQFVCGMLNWTHALSKATQVPGRTALTCDNSPEMHDLVRQIGFSTGSLPLVLYATAAMLNICQLNGQMKLMSRFFRESYPKVFADADTNSLKTLRNKAAHFDDYLAAVSKASSEIKDGKTHLVFDLELFEDGELGMFQSFCRSVPSALRDIYTDHVANTAEDAIINLTHKYGVRVLGVSSADPAKRALLDQEVNWLSTTNTSPTVTDAYVLAAGRLAQRFAPADAERVFTYLHRHNGKLKTPGALLTPELLAKEDGNGIVLQEGVRQFAGEMRKALGIKEMQAVAA